MILTKKKRLKPLGRARYGNPDKRSRVPCWSISTRAKNILITQAKRHNATQSYIFETMIKNIMLLNSIEVFRIEVDASRGNRREYMPKLAIHPVYIKFIQNFNPLCATSAVVSCWIEAYEDKYDFELHLPVII